MHAHYRRRYRTLALVFIVFGLLAFLVSAVLRVPSIAGFGLGAFLIGLLLAYLPSAPTVTMEIVGEAFMPTMSNLEALLRSFGVSAPATYLPPEDAFASFRVFVPLTQDSTVRLLDRLGDDILITSDEEPGMNGLLLEPPGAALLTMLERESGQDLAVLQLNELEEALRIGTVDALEISTSIHLRFEDSHVQFRLEGDMLWEFSEKLAKNAPTVCDHIGCPICSLAACALAKVSHKNVRFLGAKHFNRNHLASLELLR